MSIAVTTRGDQVVISLGKRFDFNEVEAFRDAYIQHPAASYVIDFRNTDYMDSSGLGMLLNMRRQLGDQKADISLVNCRMQVKKVLTIVPVDENR